MLRDVRVLCVIAFPTDEAVADHANIGKVRSRGLGCIEVVEAIGIRFDERDAALRADRRHHFHVQSTFRLPPRARLGGRVGTGDPFLVITLEVPVRYRRGAQTELIAIDRQVGLRRRVVIRDDDRYRLTIPERRSGRRDVIR
jgi:hypothetical protein